MKTINLFKWTANIIIVFAIMCFGSCGQKSIDINGVDLDKTVANEVENSILKSGMFRKANYELSPIQTPKQVFQNLAKEKIEKDVILCPNVTYKLTFSDEETSYDVMAYYATKEGKLIGVGLIFSEEFIIGSMSLHTIGYGMETSYRGLIIIFLILSIFVIWVIYKSVQFRRRNFFGERAFNDDLELAQNGNVHAMVNVGLAYWRGDGVKRDLESAKYWLSRAAVFGDPNARKMLSVLNTNPNYPI